MEIKRCHHGFRVCPDTNKHLTDTGIPIGDKLEDSYQYWKKYFKKHGGEIPSDFPKTIFDNVNLTTENKDKNELRRFQSLLDGLDY